MASPDAILRLYSPFSSASLSSSFASAGLPPLPSLQSIRLARVKLSSAPGHSCVSNIPPILSQASKNPLFSIPSNPVSFGTIFPSRSATLQRSQTPTVVANGSKQSNSAAPANNVKNGAATQTIEEEEQEVEVELSWVEEKVEDFAQSVGSAVRAIPGPRVRDGELPWLLALPIGYVAISFVIAVVKTVRKYTSPKGKRRRQVGKNAWLVDTLSEYLPEKRQELDSLTFKRIATKYQFDAEEVLRKYIRYALNERPFGPEVVADLIHLRKVSLLDDQVVAEIMNEVSRRIVKAKGPVVVDTTGFTERGLKRKVAVQALFCKILYLSELDEFCSTTNRSSLSIKEIFGVTDEDANLMRIDTLSGETEVESLEKLVGSSSEELDEDEK